jgi:hypothetical protein
MDSILNVASDEFTTAFIGILSDGSAPPKGLHCGTAAPAAGAYRYHPRHWGTWVLDPYGAQLWEPASGCMFSLAEFGRSSHMLDMVFQVFGHDGDGQLTAGFVGALRDIIDPQANLCSWGEDKHLTKAAIRRMAAAAAACPSLIASGRIGKCPS